MAGTLAGLGGIPSYVAGVALLLHRAPLALLLLDVSRPPLRGTVARALAARRRRSRRSCPDEGGPCATAAVAFSSRRGRARGAACLAGAPAAVGGCRRRRGRRRGRAVLGAAELGAPTELLVAYDIVLLATAVALLVPLAGGRWQAAAASGLVVELGATPPGAPVTGRLAEVLHDPGLELRLRLPGGGWTDEAGRPAPEPARPRRAPRASPAACSTTGPRSR